MPSAPSSPLSDAELLARLVGFDTVSHRSNLAMVDFLADYLAGPRVRVERNFSADGTKANLIVHVGPEADGSRRGLLLSGHMDVVPAGEPGWTSDPFTLTERGEVWVGRGACDMKGFLALASNLAREAAQDDLTAPLALLFTYDEEVGTLGARRFVESYTPLAALPREAIIGEPTSLGVVRLHKGHLKLRATFRGLSAHSGYPHLGANAIEPAAEAIRALAELRHALANEGAPGAEHDFPEVPFAALNVGTVHGGSAINVVPDTCTVEIGIRTLPRLGSKELERRARAAIESVGLGPGVTVEIQLLSDSPPMSLAADAPLVQLLNVLTGQDDTRSVSFATDAGWLQTAGFDCVICGPGTIEVAHKPNEFLPKSEFAAARDLLLRTIAARCRA